jgi:hypothetical protein
VKYDPSQCIEVAGTPPRMVWKQRPREHFDSDRSHEFWNKKYSGKAVRFCGKHHNLVSIDGRRLRAGRIERALRVVADIPSIPNQAVNRAPKKDVPWRQKTQDHKKIEFASAQQAGITFQQFSRSIEFTEAQLYRWCIDAGVVIVGFEPAEWMRLHTTEARAARIQELDEDGCSPEQIAKALGTTTGAVGALVSRERILLQSSSVALRRPPSSFPGLPELPPETWAPIYGAPVDFLENEGCRWPVDGGCCGHTRFKKSYCEHHYHVAYPPQARPDIRDVEEGPRPRKPMSSQGAMRMAGVAARRVEREE